MSEHAGKMCNDIFLRVSNMIKPLTLSPCCYLKRETCDKSVHPGGLIMRKAVESLERECKLQTFHQISWVYTERFWAHFAVVD